MIARLLFLIALVWIAPTASATDYYLHPLGDDGAAGTTSASAWQTLAHAIPLLGPGDTLYLGGDASIPYQGQVEVEIDVSGTPGPGGRISLRNQPGHSPVISGTRLFDSGWTLHSGQIYLRNLSSDGFPADFRPLLIFQNPKGQTGGNFLSSPPDPVASLAEMSPGTWFYQQVGANSFLYVWVNDLGAGSDPNAYTIEVGERVSAMGDRTAPYASHLLFEGLEFRGYTGVSLDTPLDVLLPGAVTFRNSAAISATSNRQDITFRSCTFRQNWKGLQIGAVNDLVIDASLFSENIAAGAAIGLTSSPDPQTGFLMTDSSILDTYGPWPAKAVADSNPAAIKLHKLAGGAIRNTLIRGAHLNRAGDYAPHGIWTDVDVSDFVIEDNVIRDIDGFAGNFSGRGIFIERRADRNLVRRNLIVNTQQGIVLGTKGQPVTDWPEGAEIHNNTIVDSLYTGIHVLAAVEPDIYNNIIVGTGQTAIRVDSASHAYHEQNGVAIWIEANESWDATPPGPGLFYAIDGAWNAAANRSAAMLASETGISGLAQEVNDDPLLVDPGNEDYSLSASSPAIDRGLATGESFNGSGVDLGYLEFTGAVAPLPSLPAAPFLLLAVALGGSGMRCILRARGRDYAGPGRKPFRL